ncbi:MAG: response regulator [Christensenellaceae bacterium]|nr:response regulator [Christensenellaceae bacterium]
MAKRILICDDSPFMRLILKEFLLSEGYEIAGEAENGEQAIARYKDLKPDLLLMDITMPVMDGLQALKMIIEEDRTAKVIMASAIGQQEFVMQCMKNGAKDFVIKPYKKERIIEAVAKALK